VEEDNDGVRIAADDDELSPTDAHWTNNCTLAAAAAESSLLDLYCFILR